MKIRCKAYLWLTMFYFCLVFAKLNVSPAPLACPRHLLPIKWNLDINFKPPSVSYSLYILWLPRNLSTAHFSYLECLFLAASCPFLSIQSTLLKEALPQKNSQWISSGSRPSYLPIRTAPYVVVQLLSHVQLFVTPWTAALQASLSFTLPELAQTHVH